MTYVVTENCIKCKYMDCVEVCPVDCFFEGPNFLVIHPDQCIDCAVCVPECPADAIFADTDVPPSMVHFIKLNADLSATWPGVSQKSPPPDDADAWNGVPDKLKLLEM